MTAHKDTDASARVRPRRDPALPVAASDAVWMAFRERILNPPAVEPASWLEAARKIFTW